MDFKPGVRLSYNIVMTEQHPETIPDPANTLTDAIVAAGENLISATVDLVASIEDPLVQAELVHSFADKLKEKGVQVHPQDMTELSDNDFISDNQDDRRGHRTHLTRAQLIARRTLIPPSKVAAVKRFQRLQLLEETLRSDKKPT